MAIRCKGGSRGGIRADVIKCIACGKIASSRNSRELCSMPMCLLRVSAPLQMLYTPHTHQVTMDCVGCSLG